MLAKLARQAQVSCNPRGISAPMYHAARMPRGFMALTPSTTCAWRTGGNDLGAPQPFDLLIKLGDARSRAGSQRAAERQRPLSSRDRPSFAAVATAGMCQSRKSGSFPGS
jgi:hypothetical protein